MISDSESSENQDYQEEFFNAIKKSVLPANQLITKKYNPDQNPQLKIVLLSQTNTVSPFINPQSEKEQNETKKYIPDFRENDTLGYYLKDKIGNNLLYLKFDNKFFNTCPQNRLKYLAGFFTPINLLLKPQIKLNKNFYQTLRQTEKLNFLSYQDNPNQFFKENCFSSQKQIKFSSNYESANLLMALKSLKQNQYDLILQNDLNSKGTTQWFNFSVHFPQKRLYKFNIVNLVKSHSLFEKGMGVCLFSDLNHQTNNKGWIRGCSNITYGKNEILREGSFENFYSTLHFQFQNQIQGDTVTFSYGYPYTGIDLQKFFSRITQRKLSSMMTIQKIKISETLSGFPVYAYHIFPKKQMLSFHNLHRTQMNLYELKNNKNSSDQKPKGIVFMSRQHPGQSQSSFILQGIIEFIMENNEYDSTKKSFHYYILPMVNVDGVYYGNYRTNLSGNDLNRIWRKPRKDFHPQVYAIKKYLYAANRSTEIKLIIDLHGHSAALNSFFYGNPMKKQGVLQLKGENPKLFPYFCSKQMKQISFVQSTFSISQDKKNSARVVLNEMFPKASVYTLETSFYGYKKGQKIVEFTIEKYKKLGRNFIGIYFQYMKITQRVPLIKLKWEKQIQMLQQKIKTQPTEVLANDSDSEAQQQLIEFQKDFEIIDLKRYQHNQMKQKQTQESGKYFGEKSFNIHQRLYDRRKVNNNNKSGTEQSMKKPPFSRVFYHDSPQSPTMNSTSIGFLSIVKIQTKNSISEKKQNDSSKIVNKIQGILNGNSSQSRQMKENNTESSQFGYRVKTNFDTTKIEKNFKKEYSVRSLKHKNQMLREKMEIRYMNEKQFLESRRRSLNRQLKLNQAQLGYEDAIFQEGQKRCIVHSKSSNALVNLKKATKGE